jgi:NAD-dependent SIR2 family protein deacetylase
VNFGDNLHRCISGGLNRAEKFFKNADLCLALRTSLTVYPASDFPLQSKQLVIVNLQKTDLDRKADVRVFVICDAFFDILMHRLAELTHDLAL